MATSEEKSIASSVKELVSYHPSLRDCLALDLLNYSAAADFLKPKVEANLKRKEISLDAIKMALIRLRDEIRKEVIMTYERGIVDVIKNSKLELKNEITVVTVELDDFKDIAMDVMRAASRSRFMQITQGISSVTVALDHDLYERMGTIFSRLDVRDIITDQSAIVMISPKEIIQTPGVISYVVSLLFRNNLNITQIMSCYTDTILIVSRKEALRAYSILENAILGLRELL